MSIEASTDTITISLSALQTGLICVAIALGAVGVCMTLIKLSRRDQEKESKKLIERPIANFVNDSSSGSLPTFLTSANHLEPFLPVDNSPTSLPVVNPSPVADPAMDAMEREFRIDAKAQAKRLGLPEHEMENFEVELARLIAKCRQREIPWVVAFTNSKGWVNRRMAHYRKIDSGLDPVMPSYAQTAALTSRRYKTEDNPIEKIFIDNPEQQNSRVESKANSCIQTPSSIPSTHFAPVQMDYCPPTSSGSTDTGGSSSSGSTGSGD